MSVEATQLVSICRALNATKDSQGSAERALRAAADLVKFPVTVGHSRGESFKAKAAVNTPIVIRLLHPVVYLLLDGMT